MEQDNFSTYLTILTLLQSSNPQSYYARTKEEKSVFSALHREGFVTKRAKTKYCYELSTKGIQETTNILHILKKHSIHSDVSLIKKCSQLLFDSILFLSTPLRPMVKIPDLWNHIQREYGSKFSWESFKEILLNMHIKGDITLQNGFSINETKDGIKTLQGDYFYYVMIDN